MEALMREHGIPLYTLESKRPLACFDLIGFTLPYETLYTNTLNILDLAGIPVRSADRDETHPIIIAGGHSATNPEPMHAFIDAFAIGEGEEVIHDIVNTIQKFKASSQISNAKNLLVALAQIPGVYVPQFYETTYLEDGTVAHTQPIIPEAPKLVTQAHRGETASAACEIHRAEYRSRPQPRLGGDHARMHARVSILSGGHDHPSRTRKKRARGGGCRRCRSPLHRI